MNDLTFYRDELRWCIGANEAARIARGKPSLRTSLDWSKIAKWYLEYLCSIYPEPSVRGHRRGTKEVIKYFIVPRRDEIKTVLDIGCGCGDSARFFRAIGIKWQGVTLGAHDLTICRRRGLNVIEADMHFIPLPNESVDLCFCRHIAEHSPMPYFFAKEVYRLSRKYCLLVVPRPPFFCIDEKTGYRHPNHLSAGMTRLGWIYIFQEAGWEFADEQYIPTQVEERLFFQKSKS